LGLSGVWGNPGRFTPKDYGYEVVLGTRERGLAFGEGHNVKDPQFWNALCGVLCPVDATG
jgi:hypothetical protein